MSDIKEKDLTDYQADMLRHMLGINDPYKREPEPYRNHYAASPGSCDMVALERIGLVERVSGPSEMSPYVAYRCTELGRDLAISSYRRIRKPKKERIYRRYRSIADVLDLTFHEFIASPEYAQARAEA